MTTTVELNDAELKHIMICITSMLENDPSITYQVKKELCDLRQKTVGHLYIKDYKHEVRNDERKCTDH